MAIGVAFRERLYSFPELVSGIRAEIVWGGRNGNKLVEDERLMT